MIRVSSLTRCYGDLTAVHNAAFSIQSGEVVGLLGHNGAGKTTIMKMLTGYLEPTDGEIEVDGLNMGPDTRAIQARIGYLPENCPVWPEMTVIDYLEYQAALRKVPMANRQRAIADALRRTDLKDKAMDPIHTLSRGYRQRVGVAQAILHSPDIIILDEPTNGLDPTQIRQMRTLIRDLAKSATVVISTHILQEVEAVCERVLILRAGEVVVDSPLMDLQRSDGFSVVVAGDADPEDVLSKVEVVSEVTHLGDDDMGSHFEVLAPASSGAAISHAIVEAGLALQALTPIRHDLESTFAQVAGQTIVEKEEAA